ncbi:MAG: hypothetical protein NC395_01615 [Prevotella sp.]|nr:hypothetical protein [Prevotella sp.]
MKKSALFLSAVIAAVSFFAACGKAEEPIDVSDVKDMMFGSELPNILYYSEEKAIIDGSFGVVVYDIENSRLADRITFDKIREWGMTGYRNYVSADGKTIYITDMRQTDGVTASFVAYDAESKTASPAEAIPDEESGDGGEECFRAETADPYNPHDRGYKKYSEYFKKYSEQNCLIGYTVIPNENEFVFLAIPSGMLYDTQIVVCDNNGGEKVYKIFQDNG